MLRPKSPSRNNLGSKAGRWRPLPRKRGRIEEGALHGSDDLFGPSDDLFGQSDDLFGLSDDLFGPSDDLFGLSDDLFGPSDDLFGLSNDLFGLSDDIIGPSDDLSGRQRNPLLDPPPLRGRGRHRPRCRGYCVTG